ncbi:acyl-CoA dehydrogenase family protein [uncultured Pseudacidovorax sp.]|uniref:acyl-CoA dehydrogenase family protein n=1 Tax=uncultured Pseudacidovorax sp. TaxID=679313 RepID=UPI0025E43A5D|nr:acyl-CoA dehydrogenase family protein [uncultured Pseudacidovorax sp.]
MSNPPGLPQDGRTQGPGSHARLFFEAPASDTWTARAHGLRRALQADAPVRDQAGARPVAALALLKGSGLLSALVPVPQGGAGAAVSGLLRAVRELARTDASVALLLGHHLGAMLGLAVHGGDRAAALLAATVSQRWLWTHPLDTDLPTLSARRIGSGWLLDGELHAAAGLHAADRLLLSWPDTRGPSVAASLRLDHPGVGPVRLDDGFGLRQAGGGSLPLTAVHLGETEWLGPAVRPSAPRAGLPTLLQQAVRTEVFIGTAWGALEEGRAYTVTASRPWIHSGVERHEDDPWIQRRYGELALNVQAATELADRAGRAFDLAQAAGDALASEAHDALAVQIADAHLEAAAAADAAGSGIFELMGARSATVANGYDRFWRDARALRLPQRTDAHQRALGRWLLGGAVPLPTPSTPAAAFAAS